MELTLEAFIAMFGTLGYAPCNNQDFEEGFKKIAIYSRQGVPTHAARQLPNKKWTSKIGKNIDIEHTTPQGLEGPFYGDVAAIMKKPV